MWAVRAILTTILLIVVLAFAYGNFSPEQVVDVRLEPFFENRVDVPLVTVVFWAFVAGSLMAMILFVSAYVKTSLETRSFRRRIKALESELAILRNRPIEESLDLLRDAEQARTDPALPIDRVSSDA